MTRSISRADEYESIYREFDSPLMRRLRSEAYGEDIGQHSWVSADELRGDAERLGLDTASRLLDLGSGPCGPLTFLIAHTGCVGVGLELSSAAIAVGHAKALELGVESRFSAQVADLNDPLPVDLGQFDAVLGVDMVLHLQDRGALFRSVASILRARARLLFTDAGVVTGAISNDQIRTRSVHGYTQFVPQGWNEEVLSRAGFRLLELEDRTESVVRNAQGRLKALVRHREELEQLSGVASFAKQVEYVSMVAELASKRALSRFMYLAEFSENAA
jgi:cyclopropane fatty-acyl-phospholipid synthase-like methyltransferase